MFDDLILLAKGGLTVYHGPVKKAEEYFSSLGINVPDRVNPPDYFIDILEGIIKPNTSSGVTDKQQLPVRWMLHNGYSVPVDMLKLIEGTEASAENIVSDNVPDGSEVHSFFGDFWEDVKCSIQVKKDRFERNFLNSGDLSQRITPNAFQQYRYFLGRYMLNLSFMLTAFQPPVCLES